jgi:hypothetical protein
MIAELSASQPSKFSAKVFLDAADVYGMTETMKSHSRKLEQLQQTIRPLVPENWRVGRCMMLSMSTLSLSPEMIDITPPNFPKSQFSAMPKERRLALSKENTEVAIKICEKLRSTGIKRVSRDGACIYIKP